MNPLIPLAVIFIYFSALLLISWYTSRGADSDSFFTAKKTTPWYIVAFGMIGTSLSGVTFISVPGAVGSSYFSYFQIILGYLAGYTVIATVLMPLYYRLNLVSIYTYLEQRFGFWAYKTGSFFFLISRTLGSSLRLYLAAMVLQLFLFDSLGVPFFITVSFTILLIWVYTFKGGLKTIVWTDTFQTFFLIASVVISVFIISDRLGLNFGQMITTINESKYSQVFFWDWKSDKYFFKQFIAGMFLAICMTGLDQDLMQKNISCKNIKEAQKNMFVFSAILVVVNLFFLALGALLFIYSEKNGLAIPLRTDELYPRLALQELGTVTGIFFLLGIIASSYASADSALTALTTSFCIDFLDFKSKSEKVKQQQKWYVHIGFSVVFLLVIVVFKEMSDDSLIKTVLKMASYTYGPLLGLFSFGLFSKRQIQDNLSPIICVIAPLLTILLVNNSESLLWGYKFSFEILLVNGLFTYLGLYVISKPQIAK